MKALIAIASMLFLTSAFAGDPPVAGATKVAATAPAAQLNKALHRYVVERTFPAGALDGLDSAGKVSINENNARYGVHWVLSYANPSKTKTFCIYEGPSEAAVRKAAQANKIPVDTITEVPVTLLPN